METMRTRMPFIEALEETSANTKCHLTIVKLLGVSLTLITILSPVFVILGITISRDTQHSLDYEAVRNLNLTSCVFVKQYNLGGNTYATVCNRNGDVIVDIRKFVNGTATTIGIPLELRQWLTLKRMTTRIFTAISEARTYWNSLQHL